MNKQGGEKILSIWWFFILAMVGGGIVIGVLMFHSADVDVRETEAGILYDVLLDCMVENGFVKDEVLKSFDVFEKCKLDRAVIESDFYFSVDFFGVDKKILRKRVEGGDNSLEEDCIIQEPDEKGKEIEAKHWAKCFVGKEIILYYKDGVVEKGMLKILAGSNQRGKKNKKLGGKDD